MEELKKGLKDNPKLIEKILYEYDFHKVVIGSREIRCAEDEDGNATSIRIKLIDKLNVVNFSTGEYGDLFSYIVKTKNVEFRDILKYTKELLGISKLDFNTKRKIFGGFYDNIKLRTKGIDSLQIYPDETLNDYLHKYNIQFLNDGISLKTQQKFKIGIDFTTSRITVPWFNIDGDLIGIEGRYIGDHEKDGVAKWFPIIPFKKSSALFGYHINYQYLQFCHELYIGESSKFCMQLDDMNINTALSIGGNVIHEQQIKQLLWLNPKKIILCLDEGISEEHILNQINKIKVFTRFIDIKIGYIFDENNEILQKDSKCSPSDLGKEMFNELKENYVKWSD